MHRDDTEPGSGSEQAADDPFQELERMFGGRPATDSAPESSANASAAKAAAETPVEASSEEAVESAGEAPVAVPTEAQPETEVEPMRLAVLDAVSQETDLEADTSPDAGAALDSRAVPTVETPEPEEPLAEPASLLEIETAQPPAWSGLFEKASSDPEAAGPEAPEAASTEAEVAPEQGPSLDALVAAVDAATPTVSLPTLGASSGPSSDAGSSQRYIIFSVAGTRYALEMGSVTEVGPVPPITPLPQVPAWLLGVSNLRGDILAVLDLRLYFGHTPSPSAGRDRMLVLQTGASQLTAGLVVDQVHGAGAVDLSAIRPPTAPVEGPVQPFLRGVAEHGERLLAILDSEKLLSGPELRPFAGDPQISDLGTQTQPRDEAADAAGPSPIQ